MNISEQISTLMPSMRIEENFELATYLYSQTGKTVKIMVWPKTVDELKEIIKIVKDNNISYFVIGGGTNIVAATNKIDKLFINMSDFRYIDINDDTAVLKVSAGYQSKEVAKILVSHGIGGFEWAEGLPGTIGGAIYMNASAYGPGIDGYLINATVLTEDGEIKTVKNAEFEFRYRRSTIQNKPWIILDGTFKLYHKKIWKIKISTYRKHRGRINSQPLELPSSGSVFVMPFPYHVGGLMRELGLVGHQIGGAQISPKSPGFIVGIDNMTGEDYLNLVQFIQGKVKRHYDLDLDPEVRFIGFDNDNNIH